MPTKNPYGMQFDPRTGLPGRAKSGGYSFPYIPSSDPRITPNYPAGLGTTAAGGGGTGLPSGGRVDPGFDMLPSGGRQLPDYRSLIESDPLFSQLRADLASQGISDASSRAAATRRALIGFGEVPDFAGTGLDQGYLGQDIDEATKQLATKSTEEGLSVSARLAKRREDAIRAIRNVLAARGGLRSGELGYQLGEEGLRFKQGQFDARSQLVDYVAGVHAGFAAAARERQRQLGQGAGEAAARQGQFIEDTGGTPPPTRAHVTDERPTAPVPGGVPGRFVDTRAGLPPFDRSLPARTVPLPQIQPDARSAIPPRRRKVPPYFPYGR